MGKLTFLFIFIFISIHLGLTQAGLYNGTNGVINFISEAPLETIKAESKLLQGVINPLTKEFAFKVPVNSFLGFNSDIQREHFLEDYMEQNIFNDATYTGKIIEDIPFDQPGVYQVRAKGMLNIHGIPKERIIKGTLTIKDGAAHLDVAFPVPLADHGIEIPKIVNQKIAEQIMVTIKIDFIKGLKS